MRLRRLRSVGLGPPRGRRLRELPATAQLPVLFLLPVLSLLQPSVPAAAQDCITEVTVIRGGSSGIQPPAGYTKIAVDLNNGAGGDFIYLCYKRGVGAPVTGLAVTVSSNPPPEDAVYTRIDVDLNAGAGGNFIWLWYTKDPGCATLRDLHVQLDSLPPPAGFTRIDVNLNLGAGGANIFMSYVLL